MARKSLNLTVEEKNERKRIANLKYYETKGKGVYDSKKIPKPSMTVKEKSNKLRITIDMKNSNLEEIKDFLLKFSNK